MNPERSAQDILRCHVCSTPVPPLFCDPCHTNLCKDCAGKHLLDESKEHKVVPIEQRWASSNYPKCPIHTTMQFEVFCEQCCVPICVQCTSYTDHRGHTFVDMLKKYNSQKLTIQRDLKELERSLYSRHQEVASEIPLQKAQLAKHSKRLTTALNIHGKALHREIDILMQDMQSEIDVLHSKHLAAIDQEEENITNKIREISKLIQELRKLADSTDIFLVSIYQSRVDDFEEIPKQPNIPFPMFCPANISKEKLRIQFGSLSSPLITEEQDHTAEAQRLNGSSSTSSSELYNHLLEEPELIATLDTGYNPLYNVTCLTDEDIWTTGRNKVMKLYNLKGVMETAIHTKSGHWPMDITVTRSGDFVFTDRFERTINIVKMSKIKRLVKTRGWSPLGVCCTSSDDLLVIMDSDDINQAKVVSYMGSTETQSIQWDNEGRRLFSSGGSAKYLCENKNLDICVSDRDAHAIVVVSADGKLRFRYTGPPLTSKDSFDPVGITTDNNGLIIAADNKNNKIHIIDPEGEDLLCISNNVQHPYGICLDSKDKLFVAEMDTRKVKKFRYYNYL